MSATKFIKVSEYAKKYNLSGHQAVLYRIAKGNLKHKKVKSAISPTGFYYLVEDKAI